ncbi:MAG: antirestriction protein ArdA [Lachnospiraceae bacterium]|nr:antirestriction protein ArdA [Lachnospiraceae bacterium]
MEEMRVYIANLGKYNEGELVGDWFIPPIDYDEVAERIGLNDEYEEFAVHDYELPFEIDEYTSIEEINRFCEMVEELDYPLCEVIDELVGVFGSLEELCEHKDDIIHLSGCNDMTDVAYYYIDECCALGDIPDHLSRYIDYESFGRDLDLEGRFVETKYGIFECPW